MFFLGGGGGGGGERGPNLVQRNKKLAHKYGEIIGGAAPSLATALCINPRTTKLFTVTN